MKSIRLFMLTLISATLLSTVPTNTLIPAEEKLPQIPQAAYAIVHRHNKKHCQRIYRGTTYSIPAVHGKLVSRFSSHNEAFVEFFDLNSELLCTEPLTTGITEIQQRLTVLPHVAYAEIASFDLCKNFILDLPLNPTEPIAYGFNQTVMLYDYQGNLISYINMRKIKNLGILDENDELPEPVIEALKDTIGNPGVLNGMRISKSYRAGF